MSNRFKTNAPLPIKNLLGDSTFEIRVLSPGLTDRVTYLMQPLLLAIGVSLPYNNSSSLAAIEQSQVVVSLEEREVKTVAVSPTEPHYIAVGASDPFVRVYDRRMLLTLRPGMAWGWAISHAAI